jgi:predicted transcriptional regulator
MNNKMKRLTAKEEEIMEWFWAKGPLFVKELQQCYDEPRPHFNTLSTFVRGLEEKGFLTHRPFGNTYQYFPLVTAQDYGQGYLRKVIAKYFDSSYLSVVSSLIKEEDLSVKDLRRLLDEVEEGNQKS